MEMLIGEGARLTLTQVSGGAFTLTHDDSGLQLVLSGNALALEQVLPAGLTLQLVSEGAASSAPFWGFLQGDINNQADLTALLAGFATSGAISAALAAHEGLADPHPNYLTAAEGGAAFAALVHAHVIADVTGLQAALDGKQAAGAYALLGHGHVIADTAGLQAALDGKAASAHTHAQADVTGLVAALAGKAASVHAHVIADTTGLQAALDAKLDDSQASAAGLSMLGAADAAAQTGLLNNFTAALKGLVPMSGGGTSNFLRADGAWAAPAGGGGGSVAIDAVEVEFLTAAPARFFDRAVAGALAGQKIIAQISSDMPAGVQEDELEADPLTCSARVLSPGNVRILVASASGAPIGGKRNINLIRA